LNVARFFQAAASYRRAAPEGHALTVCRKTGNRQNAGIARLAMAIVA